MTEVQKKIMRSNGMRALQGQLTPRTALPIVVNVPESYK